MMTAKKTRQKEGKDMRSSSRRDVQGTHSQCPLLRNLLFVPRKHFETLAAARDLNPFLTHANLLKYTKRVSFFHNKQQRYSLLRVD